MLNPGTPPLKDFEPRSGKLIPGASSLEGRLAESREISFGEIVNSLTVESHKSDIGGKNGKSVTGFREFAEKERKWEENESEVDLEVKL